MVLMNTRDVRVSVIVPAYNASDFIGEALDSIIAQTLDEIEIIVVDDGSTDHTAEIVKSYGSRVLYIWQENGGCAMARNRGIRASSGECLSFLDADDIYTPDRIARQVEFMERHPHDDLVFCDYLNFDDKGTFGLSHFQTCPVLQQQLNGRPLAILENACAILPHENFGIASSFMIRRRALKYVRGFEESLGPCADYHFYFRVARHGSVGMINKVGMMRRVHSRNMSADVGAMCTEDIRVSEMLLEGERDPRIRAGLNRRIATCKCDLARHYANLRRIREAIAYDWQVLTGPFFPAEWRKSCRNLVRTSAIAMGLHRPPEERRHLLAR